MCWWGHFCETKRADFQPFMDHHHHNSDHYVHHDHHVHHDYFLHVSLSLPLNCASHTRPTPKSPENPKTQNPKPKKISIAVSKPNRDLDKAPFPTPSPFILWHRSWRSAKWRTTHASPLKGNPNRGLCSVASRS